VYECDQVPTDTGLWTRVVEVKICLQPRCRPAR